MNEEILKRIDALASKLSTTVDHLWSVLCRQARVEIANDLLTVAVMCAISYALYRALKWVDMDENEGCWVFLVIASGIAMIATAIVFIACANELPTLIFNPEYWALKRIAEVVGK